MFKCCGISFERLDELRIVILIHLDDLRVAEVEFFFELFIFSMEVDDQANHDQESDSVLFSRFEEEIE